ncbi:YodC family protein [Ralstonia wenshanensis]|uniref:YodC family protein n=1 Tax=Ralstonia wenshanensis TaxID=2842456 RepID=UPI0039C62AB2
MATQFKVGDIVQLKSGGPIMTVRSLPTAGHNAYSCQWFAGKKLESGSFPLESLQAAQKDD